MTRFDVIDCDNSLINGSTLVTTMNYFHKSNSKLPTVEFFLTLYRNFIRRNKDQLESIIGERQHKLRKYWTAHENFITMYDREYDVMVNSEVANSLEKS